MSVRSGRVVKTVRTLTRPTHEAACAYTTYNCTMCNYIYTSTGKRCLRPAPTSDRKEGYCGEHSRRSLVLRQRAARRRRSRETPETLLNQLSHHQMDTQTAGQNAIPDPASVTGVASASLEYASDTDSEEEITTLPHDTLPRREADSELDSADSDADPLEHSQVFTTEEITRIYLEKLKRLKSMYIGEYKRLAHILREGRRKYLQSVTEGVNYKPGPSVGCVKCVYSEGSWRCGEKSVPLSKYCSKHILHDPNQVLFGACGVSRCGDDQCSMPVMCLPYTTTCIYHTPIPDPIPVSSPLLEDIENNAIDLSAEELSIQSSTSQLPPPGPQEIIDLSESHSFIVSEVPPENVMEGDGEETDEALSSETKS
ncbi:KAT8 regulatory NSL complex subunit 2-like [Homarus americanus]|uniref:KAT8 regulatory NSL complex subunit 2 n=1 Tax=Homarus americanus TaxID=6706 RepID=A0A8J5MUA7_HOMAM|nr:KAT8 regulatory NSL complex subunit 2-like [Homarus americanus]